MFVLREKRTTLPRPVPTRQAFTLVELLVVISIIAVLAGLVTVVAVRALDTAKQTQIVAEINQFQLVVQEYKTINGSYPPNAQLGANDLVRHLKKAFPRVNSQELNLAKGLAGIGPNAITPPLNAAEALVFWFSGFSNNPEFPLSGPGGPLFIPSTASTTTDYDNRDDRTINDAFKKERLKISRSFSLGGGKSVLLFVYHPSKSPEPFVYFDTSRAGNKLTQSDLSNLSTTLGYSGDSGTAVPLAQPTTSNPNNFEFVNPKSFQILHCGTDEEWGTISVTYPKGPFLGEVADNLSNFATGTLEDAQDD